MNFPVFNLRLFNAGCQDFHGPFYTELNRTRTHFSVKKGSFDLDIKGFNGSMRALDEHAPDQFDIDEVAHDLRFRPISSVSFALLDDRPVLFSEDAQQLYELNPTAAFIWCGLLEKKPTQDILDGLERSGVESRAARSFVQGALRNWLELGLIELSRDLGDTYCHTLRIGHCNVLIRAASQSLLDQLTSLFDQTIPHEGDIQDTYEVYEAGPLTYVLHNERCVLRCKSDELVPAFRAHLTAQIIQRNSPGVAFHAACLLLDAKGLLISGPPGAGKSTLTMHLMDAGLQYASDDIVLIAPNGEAIGVPFVPTLKSGSWPIVEKLRPDLAKFPIHRRGDGKQVRYLKPRKPTHTGKFPLNWIVFIERDSTTSTRLEPLSQIETMKMWIDATYSPEGRLSIEAFHSIKRALTNAKSFRLHYADAALAKDILIGLCNDQL